MPAPPSPIRSTPSGPRAYQKVGGVQLNYQAIGSGGGIKQIKAKTVTFGASDKPLKPADLKTASLVQWPMVMGGIVPVVNIEGVKAGELVFDGPTLAKIYLGEIKMWNDPEIAKLNPSLKLPASGIAVVHRSDGSGTTFNYSDYLSKVSPTWKSKVGEDASVQWPVGIGAKGNEGRRRQRQADRKFDRLRRVRLRQAEQSGLWRHDQPRRPEGRADHRDLRRRCRECRLEGTLRASTCCSPTSPVPSRGRSPPRPSS